MVEEEDRGSGTEFSTEVQSLDISLGDCGIVRHARVSKGYLAKG